MLIIYANETYHNHLSSLAQSILDMADYSIETDEPCRPDWGHKIAKWVSCPLQALSVADLSDNGKNGLYILCRDPLC